MRHSFCLYWLVAHDNDVDTLVVQSGHESKEVMWNNYYAAATKEEAAKFWAITPPRKARNVVLFKKEAA
jgi:integrase